MESERGKLVEMDHLAAAPTNDEEVNMDAQKCSGAKDTSGHFSSANYPISVAAQKNTFVRHELKISFDNQNNIL